MDRHTESFICLSLFVILLQNTARSEECNYSYREAPGNISELMDTNHPTYQCRYHVVAPAGHYIRLSVTSLLGWPLVNECLPRIVIRNIVIGQTGEIGQTPLGRICYNQGKTLPFIVQSTDNELKITFRRHDRQTSSFNATFTFHRKSGASAECLECARATHPDTRLSDSASHTSSSNASVMSTPGSTSSIHPQQTEPPAKTDPRDLSMELVVLILLAPLTVVCVCWVIMYYRRRTNSSTHQQTQRLPSDTSPPVSASHDPLLLPHSRSRNFPSSIHHQRSLRDKRETICRRSESTEKFPSSVVLPDEEESSTMQNVVLNRDICRDNGIRPPPNRTVYDSQIYENRMIEQRSRQQQQQQQHQQQSLHVTTPQTSVPRNPPLLRTDSARSGTSRNILVDSVTKSPLQFGDSDSEGPPPYICVTTSIPSNTGNVCDPQHFVSNSAAAAAAGHQVRHHGRGAHPQHANGRHPPVPLSPHYELDADQMEQVEVTDRLERMERSDHEITDIL